MNVPNIKLLALRERMQQSLWPLPLLLISSATLSALALVWLDHRVSLDSRFGFGGGAVGAREVISTIVGSMVAFIGTVFSITVIVLQLASSQFSPRALRTFLGDRKSQVPLGVFLATLVYALVVLWTIRVAGDTRDTFVPNLAISGAYVLVLASVVTFVYYIHHVSQSIRVANIVHRIGVETLETLESRYPEPYAPELSTRAPDEPIGVGNVISSGSYGIVTAFDTSTLAARAKELDGVIELLPSIGDFVPRGAPIARWSGPSDAADDLDIDECVSLGRERTMKQDLGFGLRQLVDIAEKALSPGVNDPTTATQALDQIHNVMRQLATRRFPDEVIVDDRGAPRVLTHERRWEDLVRLAFEEVREYGAESSQLRSRLEVTLQDLAACVPMSRRPAIIDQLEKLPKNHEVRER